MLKLAGETDTGLEKIEAIVYTPELQNTGDLEAGTHTIVPTSRPAIGSAQYSKVLTLPKPTDTRLAVKRIAARLNVNIAGLGTATTVYCSVRVDIDDADHQLFEESWTSTGSKLHAVAIHALNGPLLFSLLSDGAAHTFYFLFWADVASQATIDVVQLWEAVGTVGAEWEHVVLELTHSGLVTLNVALRREGSGSPQVDLSADQQSTFFSLATATGAAGTLKVSALLLKGINRFYVIGTVATDLSYIHGLFIVLRSEL